MIPTIINFKLSDFFNVFIVRIAAMAVIMNKKMEMTTKNVNFHLVIFYCNRCPINVYNLLRYLKKVEYQNF